MTLPYTGYPADGVIDWPVIEAANIWLDRDVPPHYQATLAQDWARALKVAEEVGEAVQAFIGYTGQNPRKGVTHDKADMLKELGDVVTTGILAIQHFTGDTYQTAYVIRENMRKLASRIPALAETALIDPAEVPNPDHGVNG